MMTASVGKKIKIIFLIFIVSLLVNISYSQFSIALAPGQISEGEIFLNYRNTTVYAPAVARTDEGYTGVISTITVTVQNNGSGRVFVDTWPLTQIDMQGSARLAIKVAGTLVKREGINADNYDFFFVVRTDAPVIGGPSAGGIMTVAAIALLENWTIDNKTVMTGMINPDGSIGPVGGIPQKIDAAYSVGATRFLFPKGQGTYTEMITETIGGDIWRRTISYPVTRNVTDYGMRYGVEAVEIADINDALRYFTGYNFSAPESDSKITTEDYTSSMKPLAMNLINVSLELYENASFLLNNSKITNRYPFYYKNQITDFLTTARDRLEEATGWFNHGLYYSSTSKSFQSLIESRFVTYACGYFNSDDEDQYILSLVNEVTSLFNNKSELARNAEITGMISLQCIGAAQQRVSEAEAYISDAHDSYNNNDYLTALYKIAFAFERSNSVGWWISIASHFNDTGEIDNMVLENLASEYIEDAQQATVYSSVIIQEVGTTTGEVFNYITDAENLIEVARANLEKEYPAAALFEALEALVKANLPIEIIDGVTEDKISRARESASNSISESRNIGVEPVLAVSYFEYAQSLVNESLVDSAIVYYKYSDIIAGALSFTNFSATGSSSRHVGIPEMTGPLNFNPQYYILNLEYLFIMAILGGIAGLGLGLIIGSRLSKSQKEEYQSEWIPKNIEDYYKKQK